MLGIGVNGLPASHVLCNGIGMVHAVAALTTAAPVAMATATMSFTSMSFAVAVIVVDVGAGEKKKIHPINLE